MNDTSLDQVLTQRREARKEIVNVDEPAIKLVIFALGKAWFAFHGDRIREILAQADVFFVPGCPPSLEGVINVRGDIESVIRLHEMLHLSETGSQHPYSILLGQGSDMRSGIRVDQVVDVVDVPQSNIQPPPSTLPDHMARVVSGIIQFQGHPVTVLDLEKIFSDYAQKLG